MLKLTAELEKTNAELHKERDTKEHFMSKSFDLFKFKINGDHDQKRPAIW